MAANKGGEKKEMQGGAIKSGMGKDSSMKGEGELFL